MSILKKENWWIWLLLMLFSNGASDYVLGAILEVYDKDAWYAKWQYWLIGILLFIFPAMIMICIFSLEIMCKSAAKLKVAGHELYLSPYVWILLLIVPIIGWILFMVMILYIKIMTLVMLYRGAGEEYIEKA